MDLKNKFAFHDVDAALEKLVQIHGVSGNEGAVRKAIYEMVKPLADEIVEDRIGNLVAIKRCGRPGAPVVMLAAYMDEIGMIVTGINENGLLSYETVGGIDARVVVSKRVVVGKDNVPGVIGAKAIHLQSPEEFARALKHTDLYIDIGAKDRASAEALVSPGDYVAFQSDYVRFGKGMVKAKALDDRAGCLNLIRILSESYPCDVICAFTVMEEIGLRGAQIVGQTHPFDLAVVLETTAVNDLGEVDPHLAVAELGKGVTLSFMDRASIAHKGLYQRLMEAADKNQIAWQVKRFVSGGNDAGALQTAQGARPVAVLSVPCRYIHSHSSVAHTGDIDAQAQLVYAFLKDCKEGIV